MPYHPPIWSYNPSLNYLRRHIFLLNTGHDTFLAPARTARVDRPDM